ncbi:hypothetical protein N7486_002441 [Penicillium sp. IBT 16267x]|nr:hypothetical protein N7486_002441 [Penicillium sp. IBT 16267x]
MFGVVHRPSFESQLRTHFQQRNTSERECPSWYALRNIVYALGCRSAALQDWGAGSLLPPVEASNYFENAFSVYADLLYTPAEFASVQALTLLTFYTEGLGNPSLEYMLCATAARLGQAQGLHREPAKAWQLSPSENFHRSCVFWAIYCTEKQISFRSGRPSAIDDDDINCPLPESTVSEGEGDIEVFQSVINHAQLCSSMHKQLSSVQALRQSFENTISTVSHLSSRLEQWRESLPLNLRPGTSINASGIDSKRKPRIIFLHYLYYASLISLNANFSYPWICDAIWTTRSEALREQIARSTEIVAEASRNIILLSHYTEVDLTFPTWVVFYFPILGMINLFISILKSPTSSSVKSDLALLDIGAGYFGHIDFMSASELSISLPKDIATLAAKFAKDMKVEHEANVCQVSTIPQAREKAKSVTENGLFDNDPLRLSEPENIDFNIEHQDISMEVMDILAGGNLNFDWSQS